ncbi:hypothetical protein ACN38_g5032 [Penicillium nordicum]|uniref:Uncharacterized protein n=1 Tax=Penicillium nordicum TaxID=229535 RepID=A0A0M9WGK6_9EURO|nr:hypothetical protein ACN38_g5032 [Penicillium nordicum]
MANAKSTPCLTLRTPFHEQTFPEERHSLNTNLMTTPPRQTWGGSQNLVWKDRGLQWQCCVISGSGSTDYRLGRLTRSGPIEICA